jgi:A/G-specific adenine glycosylase
MSETQFVKTDSHSLNAVAFRKALTSWGQEHFRSFPWRLTDDPYCILIAEIMLHRTQAPQVVSVYKQFVVRYPDIYSLAQAEKETLHQVLYSLGLRWRIDLIHAMAAELMNCFGGQVPCEKASLLSLPGVSDYIASAVRCFAWNLSEPLIDTNVVRVIGRLFGLETRDSSRRNQRFKQLSTALVDPKEPRLYNYALLDLADQICMKKRSPLCQQCPVAVHCVHGVSALAEMRFGDGR